MAEVVNEVEITGGVLAGHDGSAASAEALRWASRVAKKLDEPLHVLRAWGMLNAPTPPTKQGGYIPPLVDWEAAVRDELAAQVDALGLDCQLELHVVHAQSSKALLHAADGPRCWSSPGAAPAGSAASGSAPRPTRWRGTRPARSSSSRWVAPARDPVRPSPSPAGLPDPARVGADGGGRDHPRRRRGRRRRRAVLLHDRHGGAGARHHRPPLPVARRAGRRARA